MIKYTSKIVVVELDDGGERLVADLRVLAERRDADLDDADGEHRLHDGAAKGGDEPRLLHDLVDDEF